MRTSKFMPASTRAKKPTVCWNCSRSAPAGKTAILVRARSHLAAIVPLLKKNRIPFQAVEIDQLGERPVVEDLMASDIRAAASGRPRILAR